jgi:hypothetical protein
MRSSRLLLMLVAYIDDSNMTTKPVAVLGGWLGSAKEWAKFSDCWEKALWMKPRLRYFKLSEAQSLSGEFGGWSGTSRDERIRLLIKIIERHKFLGVTCAWPMDDYKQVFGDIPDKGIDNPYFLAFYSIVVHLAGYCQKNGDPGPIDFVFDIQPGKVEIVIAAWERFLQESPPELRPMFGDYPIFRNDLTTLPLQAADLGVGWSRQLAEDHFYGRPNRIPPWGGGLQNRYKRPRTILDERNDV